MNYPSWLGKLSKKDENLRAANGLFPAKDGWYKTVNLKKRYIAKPMPLADALILLPAKLAEFGGVVAEKQARLAVGSSNLRQLTEMFQAHLWHRHETGQPRKLSRRTYDDYCDMLARFCLAVGEQEPAAVAGPAWFSRFARTIAHKAASSRRRDIIYLTAFFNWAGPGRHAQNFYKTGVNFGPDLVKPTESAMRAGLGERTKLYTADEFFAAMMAVRDFPLLYAAGLLGLNGAFLASDLVTLPVSAIDFDTGVVSFPRAKTGVDRITVLMPETLKAVELYLAHRVQPEPDAAGLLFVNDRGRAFANRKVASADKRASHGNALARYWSAATGMAFAGLRTTFATNADGHADQRAIDMIMGHAATSVRSKHYVKNFEPARCCDVVEHVWRRCVSAVPLPCTAALPVWQTVQARRKSSVAPETPAKRSPELNAAGARRRATARRSTPTPPSR